MEVMAVIAVVDTAETNPTIDAQQQCWTNGPGTGGGKPGAPGGGTTGGGGQ
jgi:hypothetical protein